MAGKAAEKFIILTDAAEGLLARVHFMMGFKRPDLFSAEVDKYIKALCKKFPEPPTDLDKVVGADIFQKKASEFVAALKGHYLTFVDIITFVDEAWKFIVDFSQSTVDLKWNTFPEVVSQFMTLLCRYAQLLFLLSNVDERITLIATYARAYQLLNGNSEPNLSMIITFLKKHERPQKVLQEECESISVRVGDALMSLAPLITKWADPKLLQELRPFNVLDDARLLTSTKGEQIFLDLSTLDDARMWLLYGFLLCPAELLRPGAVELLKLVIRDTQVVPMYRDRCLLIQDIYKELFKNYVKGKVKLEKQRKSLKEALAEWDTAVDQHAQLRVVLRVELDNLTHVFEDLPALLGPKLPLAMAAMRLARDEILWYVRHLPLPPAKNCKKVVEPEPAVAVLVHQLQVFQRLFRQNQSAISKYYCDFLTSVDYPNLEPHINAILKSGSLSPNVQNLLTVLPPALQNRTPEQSCNALRLNIQRLYAALNSSASGVKTQLVTPVLKVLSLALLHSRCIDGLEGLLKQHASLRLLYWYRGHSHRCNPGKMLGDVLSGALGSCAPAMSLVLVAAQAVDNIHRMCPEEQEVIGQESTALAESFLASIVRCTQEHMTTIVQHVTRMREQTSAFAVISRIGRDESPPLPGYESSFTAGDQVSALRTSKQVVAELCASAQQTDTITVFSTEMCPREYLLDLVSTFIRTSLRALLYKPTDPNKIATGPQPVLLSPLAILQLTKDIVAGFQHMEHHVGFNLSEIVREVLLQEFSDESAGGPGDRIVVEESKHDEKDNKTNALRHIVNWYANIFRRDIGEVGIVHNRALQCFQALPILQRGEKTPQMWVDAEAYTDYQQLRALCTLLGPYGVRALERELLSMVLAQARDLKNVLLSNQTVLSCLTKLQNTEEWAANCAKLQDMDIVVRCSTAIGCILEFRALVKQALRDCVADRAPSLAQALGMATKLAHSSGLVEFKYSGLDQLASDVGIDVEESDQVLYDTLQRVQTNSQDQTLWSLLPELFGVMFFSSKWKPPCKYMLSTQGHNNNAHTIARTIHALMNVHQRCVPSGRAEGADVERRIDESMLRMLRLSAQTLVHLSTRPPTSSSAAPMTEQLHPAVAFLEQVVLGSRGRLHPALLEDMFPYTMLRTAFVHMFEKQAAAGKEYDVNRDDEKE